MMQGGSELGALGLTRAYAMHVAAPAGAARRDAVVTAIDRATSRLGGCEGRGVVRAAPSSRGTCLVAAVVVVGVVFALTGAAHGAPLEAPADPMGDYPARPEWFLMTLYELRKLFHGAGEFFGTTLAPLRRGRLPGAASVASTGRAGRARRS